MSSVISKVTLIPVAVVPLVSMAWGSSPATTSSKASIKLGIVDTFSGSQGGIGQDHLDSANIAVAQLKQTMADCWVERSSWSTDAAQLEVDLPSLATRGMCSKADFN